MSGCLDASRGAAVDSGDEAVAPKEEIGQAGLISSSILSPYLDNERILAAFLCHPEPVALFDADTRLLACNGAYKSSMAREPGSIVPGMTLEEIASTALSDGLLKQISADNHTSLTEYLKASDPSSPVQDLEFEGDIHHRVIRSVTPLGDTMITRLDSTGLVRERKAAEEAHDRLFAALNAYPFPFAIYDQADCIVIWNAAYENSMSRTDGFIETGMHRTEIAEHAVRSGLLADAVGNEDAWSSIEHQEQHVSRPVQDLRLDGDIHHRLYRTRAPNGDLVLLRVDITELVKKTREVEAYAKNLELANAEIAYQANHDQLTGLANRRFLNTEIEKFRARSDTELSGLAALAIDLDHFKLVNDSLGHSAGDEILAAVGKILLEEACELDLVARVGGDEYIILVNQAADDRRAEDLAQRVSRRLEKAIELHSDQCRIGASIGVASNPYSKTSDLLLHADIALYRAKSEGRGRVIRFHRKDLGKMLERRSMCVDLERAIQNNEFQAHFQPQVDAKTKRLVGVEVLARWNHPRFGLVGPSSFLSQAEELGMLAKIDGLVFDAAMTKAAKWSTTTDRLPKISFNVSSERIRQSMGEIIERSHHYPGTLCLEVLETVFVEQESEAFFRCLEQARAAGIQIEVDDFGSGRTSILALQKLSPNAVKIDGRIVRRLGIDQSSYELLRAIVDIGNVFGARITAEGVETEAQIKALMELNCDTLQGFFFAAPMDSNKFTEYLQLNEVKYAQR